MCIRDRRIFPKRLEVSVGKWAKLRVTSLYIHDKNGFTFTSLDPTIAEVDSEGRVYAKAPGQTEIVVTSNTTGQTISCPVRVVQAGSVNCSTFYAKISDRGLVTDCKRNRIYIPDRELCRIIALDAYNYKFIGSVMLQGRPTRIRLSPDGDRLYTFIYGSERIVEIDLDTLQVTRGLWTLAKNIVDFAVSNTKIIYIGEREYSEYYLGEISLSTGQSRLIQTPPFDVGCGPYDFVACDNDGRHVIVLLKSKRGLPNDTGVRLDTYDTPSSVVKVVTPCYFNDSMTHHILVRPGGDVFVTATMVNRSSDLTVVAKANSNEYFPQGAWTPDGSRLVSATQIYNGDGMFLESELNPDGFERSYPMTVTPDSKTIIRCRRISVGYSADSDAILLQSVPIPPPQYGGLAGNVFDMTNNQSLKNAKVVVSRGAWCQALYLSLIHI